ncbi:hypothetical protein HanIR_Chr02g0054541 [Helianthus annuus]|nr:hypothetical protein HanIR_Chr02g0054541 [Helianthus annuus]
MQKGQHLRVIPVSMQITEITFSIIQGILTIGDEEYGKFYNPYATSIVQFLKMATCATSGLDYFHNKRMEGIVVDWYHRQPQVLADVRRQYTGKFYTERSHGHGLVRGVLQFFLSGFQRWKYNPITEPF